MGNRLLAAMVYARNKFRPRAGVHGHASPIPVSSNADVPKGHLAVYVGESYNDRFVVPISYLKHPLFRDLLRLAEEENEFYHPMGGLTIPCSRNAFLDIASHLNGCQRADAIISWDFCRILS